MATLTLDSRVKKYNTSHPFIIPYTLLITIGILAFKIQIVSMQIALFLIFYIAGVVINTSYLYTKFNQN